MKATNRMDNWPIYALADYSGGGSLIQLCRSILDNQKSGENLTFENKVKQLQQIQTSDYQTGEDQLSDKQTTKTISNGRKSGTFVKGCGSGKITNEKQLIWLQLINETCSDHLESKREQILQLCLSLHKALSPFIAGSKLIPIGSGLARNETSFSQWFLKNSRSHCRPQSSLDLSQQYPPNHHDYQAIDNKKRGQVLNKRLVDERKAEVGIKRTLGGNSLDHLDEQRLISSMASIRRLSWRRKQIAGNKETKPLNANNNNPSLRVNEQLTTQQQQQQPIVQRRLVNQARTYSKDTLQLTKCSAPTQSILSKWLSSLEADGVVICDDKKARWSHHPEERGKYGESLIHILIVNQSDEHLIILVILLHLWPNLLGDVFESDKFKGLGCLHLVVAYSNELLLDYLLQVCRHNSSLTNCIEQNVTGSFFRCPKLGANIRTKQSGSDVEANYSWNWWPKSVLNSWCQRGAKVGSASERLTNQSIISTINLNGNSSSKSTVRQANYWCDQMSHWPTADGHTHLMLFDRIVAGNKRSPSSQQKQDYNIKSDEQNQGEKRLNGDINQTSSSHNNNLSSPIIYLGHSPLAWSVSFNSRSMYESLVSFGANQNSCDSMANGCLHQVVINNLNGWTRFLVKMGSNDGAKNSDGLTPFLLAAQLGRVELFNELLELSAYEFWCYSMVRCCGYPLTSLDSILNSGSKSALAVILESEVSDNEQKSRLLSSTVVKKLLEEKWHIFAKKLFYHELILTLTHLLLLTLAISLRPSVGELLLVTKSDDVITSNRNKNNLEYFSSQLLSATEPIDKRTLVRYTSELAIFVLSAMQLIRFLTEWQRYGNVRLQWTYNPLLANSVLANTLIVMCMPVRLIGCSLTWPANTKLMAQTEDVMLIVAAPLLWSSLLFFIAAFRVTGPFVAMIRHMIVRDLRQFSVIYLVFLYAFAQSIFFVNYKPETKDDSTNKNSSYSHYYYELVNSLAKSYIELWMELFKMTFGVYDLQPYRHSSLARFFFILFLYLIPILFNMLIAMMNNTYSLIINQSERAWSFQWARTLFALERTLSDKEKSKYLKLYSINMPAPKVIKLTNTTDTSQGNNTTLNEHSDTEPANESRYNITATNVKLTNFNQLKNALDANNDRQTNDSNGNGDVVVVTCDDKLNGEEAKRFVPALMIIKRMSYTRAERRRLVLGYWQKSIRQILANIKLNHQNVCAGRAG